MKKSNRIITIAAVASLAFTTGLDCFARGAKPSPTVDHTNDKNEQKKFHNNFQYHADKLKNLVKTAPKVKEEKKKATREGLNNARKAHGAQIMDAKAEKAKSKIRAREIKERVYTQADQNSDIHQTDTIKAAYLAGQSDK